ncbi:hypothetical protein [Leucobacter musarum]|uniref:hypothetical protein n=1 Tax=Leucobacter musarum TaxID=1930747 RepID=UPI0006A75FCC|nr:hypothetical protein [Leucobacter musarum]
MRTAAKNVGIIAVSLALMAGVGGCSALLPSVPGNSAASDAASSPSENTADGQDLDGACTIVWEEWGYALEPWRVIEAREGHRDFEQDRSEQLAMITSLQGIADRVEVPELRQALDATIAAHQAYADQVWSGLEAIPVGTPVDPNDLESPHAILGKLTAGLETDMAAADEQRYDLCGPMQSDQPASEVCNLINFDWVDAGLAFNEATKVVGEGDVSEGTEQAKAAIERMRTVLVQVDAGEAYDELGAMYDLYMDFTDDHLATALTVDQASELNDDELNAYIDDADAAFEEWDAALQVHEANLKTYCDTAD